MTTENIQLEQWIEGDTPGTPVEKQARFDVDVAANIARILIEFNSNTFEFPSEERVQDLINLGIVESDQTLTFTGVSGGPVQVTAKWQIIGKYVHVYIPTLAGTSDNTTTTITGLPAGAYPLTEESFVVDVEDSGVRNIGKAFVQVDGVIRLELGAAGGAASWNASGDKSFQGTTLIYRKA